MPREDIGPIKVAFGGEEVPEQVEATETKRHVFAFSAKATNLLKKILEKDSSARFNLDRIGQGQQVIAFTKNGRIIVHNNLDSIIIEQDGKENIKFSVSEEQKALDTLEGIINNL